MRSNSELANQIVNNFNDGKGNNKLTVKQYNFIAEKVTTEMLKAESASPYKNSLKGLYTQTSILEKMKYNDVDLFLCFDSLKAAKWYFDYLEKNYSPTDLHDQATKLEILSPELPRRNILLDVDLGFKVVEVEISLCLDPIEYCHILNTLSYNKLGVFLYSVLEDEYRDSKVVAMNDGLPILDVPSILKESASDKHKNIPFSNFFYRVDIHTMHHRLSVKKPVYVFHGFELAAILKNMKNINHSKLQKNKSVIHELIKAL